MDKTLKAEISTLLKNLGIPAKLLGYKYLRRAVEMSYTEPYAKRILTKVYYPTIAKEFASTVDAVERCIRHAVQYAVDKGNKEMIHELFLYNYGVGKKYPSNGEFIATLADYLDVVLS